METRVTKPTVAQAREGVAVVFEQSITVKELKAKLKETCDNLIKSSNPLESLYFAYHLWGMKAWNKAGGFENLCTGYGVPTFVVELFADYNVARTAAEKSCGKLPKDADYYKTMRDRYKFMENYQLVVRCWNPNFLE